jgi:hypothetical protein
MTVALAGFLAGFVHVLSGPDHLAAIAPYAVASKRRAWRTGVRWGLGHAAGALVIGLLVLVMRDAVPVEAVSAWGERLVGVVLVGIGIQGARAGLARTRVRSRDDERHDHRHAAFSVGTLHGVAGSVHLLGMLPALALPSQFAAASYLLLFGAGSIAAMGAFASLVGGIAVWPRISDRRQQSALLGVSSVIALIVGGFWLMGAP